MSRNNNQTNLGLARLFILLVFGLIALSLLLRVFFVFQNSKFDGSHNFIVGFVGPTYAKVVSFSPQNKTISTVTIKIFTNKIALAKSLEIPIDGIIKSSKNIQDKDIASLFLKSASPFSNSSDGLTFIDAFRLFLFVKSVPDGSIYNRSFSVDLNDAQKSTILTLSFTDPAVYQENQGIQIINASDISGAGSRLANLITNIGGSPILVTTADEAQNVSKIVYYQTESYTVKKLSAYLGFPAQESDQKGIADVIIILGKDKVNNLNF
ncbi:MAG TPA: LytR C-terminal domain-containing protein [Patescibacteria group bacterium]|nr:LytR C-terminal domain-containing protein [Patescibacteria group bacterium]